MMLCLVFVYTHNDMEWKKEMHFQHFDPIRFFVEILTHHNKLFDGGN